YWTVWVGYVAIVVGVVELHSGAILQYVPAEHKAKVALVFGVLVVFTRIRRDLMAAFKRAA
ncbi:MAG: hypothetical protein ACK52I_37820, partial [Pseudomonadota bacterium]